MAGKIVFTALSVLYPVLVYCGLTFWGLSPRRLSILLLALAFYQFLNFTRSKKDDGGKAKNGILVLLMVLCGAVAFFADSLLFIKFYPVLVNLSLLLFFGFTLLKKPSFIFRMANLGDKTIKDSPSRNYVEKYCDKVTLAWCIFFVCNAGIAAVTVFAGSDRLWSLYNGLISYILIGLFFAVEFVVRKVMQGKLNSYVPVSELEKDSRPDGARFCFDDSSAKTWKDFVGDVSKVRIFLESRENIPWILHCDDVYFFLVSLVAVLQSGRKALVTANRQDAFIKEIQKEKCGFITDEPFAPGGATLIQDLLKLETDEIRFGKFDLQTAEMVVYTSGTTGRPKAVFKMFSQLENEVRQQVKVFGNDWMDREIYSTVNHHHMFGLPFAVLFPLAAGIPFRRRRFDFPTELLGITGKKAVIVSSPAFLKRMVVDLSSPVEFEATPMFLSAGGVLPEDVAQKVHELTRNWTTEIYGSTETGIIAHRVSGSGAPWAPFEYCSLSVSENGCLNIKSSAVLEPEGFTSGDLVEFFDDGCFVLKGRADSIVKIEEKRISLPEVEMRLKSTGLVHDVRVVPMAGKRQYLAAALVLNELGREKFAGCAKLKINEFFRNFLSQYLESTVTPKKWRYLEELPQDLMGKIRMRDIQDLFSLAESQNFKILKLHRDVSSFAAKLLFPATSDFYDGHFPEFKLLPAVAQVDMVLLLARTFLNAPREIVKINRTKFTNPIFPDVPVNLQMNYDEEKGKLSFGFTDELGTKALSSGSILMKK
ncbi:MAG: AMP-binding protein [Fibrobacter sp.]|nr:AMP-binding protein [Fibrobacter sp.]